MSWLFGFGDYGGYGYDGPDRSQWEEKSDVALEREYQAMDPFKTTFMETASNQTEFPLVEPAIHLTAACWKTFREYVESKGCIAKRRQIAELEKAQLKSKSRKGKMYAISVTTLVHPGVAKAARKEKRRAARAKAEKARFLAEEKRKKEAEMVALVAKEYAKVEEVVADSAQSTTYKKHSLSKNEDPVETSPAKKAKVAASTTLTEKIVLTAPTSRLLQEADHVHHKKVEDIRSKIQSEKMRERLRLWTEIYSKWERLSMESYSKFESKERKEIKKASMHRDSVKKTIQQMAVSGSTSKMPKL